ncbi:MAG TPA: FeoB-associated Cys-rich membrane protein [Candidatus Faecousia faecigallinarum]|nr:FeoB-associated Cys-rich membrane protein [Candidatus Faecousia faecigallinarum]
MFAWFGENLATIVVGLVLLGIVAAIVVHLVKQRKSGRCHCGSSCGSCPMCGSCHPPENETK